MYIEFWMKNQMTNTANGCTEKKPVSDNGQQLYFLIQCQYKQFFWLNNTTSVQKILLIIVYNYYLSY